MGALFKSSASTAQSSSQATNQQDNRIVNGDGAVAFSNSNGNSISSSTDNSLRYDNHSSTDNSLRYDNHSSNDSHNISNVTTTDFGAIQGSMSLIASGQRENTAVFQSALHTGEGFFEQGIGFADHALQGVISNSSAMIRTTEQVLNGQAATQANATAAIKDAFTTAKSGEQKIMVGAALAIVAIVALRK
jgi:hypothetical protein